MRKNIDVSQDRWHEGQKSKTSRSLRFEARETLEFWSASTCEYIWLCFCFFFLKAITKDRTPIGVDLGRLWRACEGQPQDAPPIRL